MFPSIIVYNLSHFTTIGCYWLSNSSSPSRKHGPQQGRIPQWTCAILVHRRVRTHYNTQHRTSVRTTKVLRRKAIKYLRTIFSTLREGRVLCWMVKLCVSNKPWLFLVKPVYTVATKKLLDYFYKLICISVLSDVC